MTTDPKNPSTWPNGAAVQWIEQRGFPQGLAFCNGQIATPHKISGHLRIRDTAGRIRNIATKRVRLL